MATSLTPSETTSKCTALKSLWAKRDLKFKDWMALLSLQTDANADPDLESFVSNEPRTQFDTIVHLLAEPNIPHRVPAMDLPKEFQQAAADTEIFLARAWKYVYAQHRSKGGQSWIRDLTSYVAAFGWYSVFAMIDPVSQLPIAEVWHPSTVFPAFGTSSVPELSHIFTMNEADAKRFVVTKQWKVENISGTVTFYDYWWTDDQGKIWNSVVVNGVFAKPPTVTNFTRMPIFVSPIGGLPDRGELMPQNWQEVVGQGVLAANEGAYKAYNKQWSFGQQMVRDTAIPRWLELSASGKILKEENMWKRGAVFKGQIGDTVMPLPVPIMPIEMRADRIDIEGQIQRGSLPWNIMGGNMSSSMTPYLQAQATESAQRKLQPYHQGIINLLSDIDNFWLVECRTNNYRPLDIKKLPKLPEDALATADYTIKIPGDLTARATVARMLDPNFKLSTQSVMELQFPEIKNPIKEMAIARANAALTNPLMAMADFIMAAKNEAENQRALNNPYAAGLFDKIAAAAEAQIAPQQQQQGGQSQQSVPTPSAQPPSNGGVAGVSPDQLGMVLKNNQNVVQNGQGGII